MADRTGRVRLVTACVIAALMLTVVPAGSSAEPGSVNSLGAQVLDAATIHDEQAAVVNHNDQIPIRADERAVALSEGGIAHDRQAIADDIATGNAAGTAHQAAINSLSADTAALVQAAATLSVALTQVDGDRARLRALAVGTYTGEFTNPQPSGSPTPQADQQAAIDVAEVKVVAAIVDRRLRVDIDSLLADTRERDRLGSAVSADQAAIAASVQETTAAAARLRFDDAALTSDEAGLSDANRGLAKAQAKLTADLASVVGASNAAPGLLTLLGGSAMTAAELAAWYHFDGYSDLTSAPIDQLAAWYIADGEQEGVRGDVAFAQAMLETGGFSSPDATDYNNYAGIGHCDSCASGWQFPSPAGGVLGQIQLLRIFATTDAPPPGAPPPVLPSLTVSKQHEAGCCPSVESLTGVWATDPAYGTEILGIYQQMLEYVLSQR